MGFFCCTEAPKYPPSTGWLSSFFRSSLWTQSLYLLAQILKTGILFPGSLPMGSCIWVRRLSLVQADMTKEKKVLNEKWLPMLFLPQGLWEKVGNGHKS